MAPAAAPRLAEIGSRSTPLFSDSQRFEHLDELLAAGPFDAVILDGTGEYTSTLLYSLRKHASYRLKLIYASSTDPRAQALADGPAPAARAVIDQQYQQWQQRHELFNRGRAPEGIDAQLLAYLWLRAPGKLLAVRDARSPQHHVYPLLDAMADGPVNGQVWIANLTQRNLIQSTELIDRIRLCKQCGSGHLNYIDVCVECNCLDIQRQPSMHCFTCGHIGPQGEFLKDGALLCPNCLTRLRHIGTDYDRPLENYHCNGCKAFFVDADVEARCLDCGTHHQPDELLMREIHHYQLSENALLVARQGLEEARHEYFSRLAMVGMNTFKTLLNWQIELIQRHKAPSFVLLGMRFRNLGSTLERLGPQRGHALLDSLIERIQEVIRDTDRCTRTSEEHLWLLLMHTDQVGLRLVTERLNRISELFRGQRPARHPAAHHRLHRAP
ncbi:diguanylate cyclase domain-containing protein [Pseudomonas sp. KNUC1026]|uniref:TackOD1 domain-containing metal-binding protein n=1 Tax=Pseudomonas sp. KNUC1026 TaxID=2893890 RepID=UPI001F26D4B7|nr:diguanylate cyclase [Pseudomonas sp. KNUC1026]UFH50568.1 diguanylate cyclase [Pseudomonas sp. KNUC1026]